MHYNINTQFELRFLGENVCLIFISLVITCLSLVSHARVTTDHWLLLMLPVPRSAAVVSYWAVSVISRDLWQS